MQFLKETAVVEFLLNKMQSMINLLPKTKVALSNIKNIEEFNLNRKDINKFFTELEMDFIQCVELTKTMYTQNVDFSEQFQFYEKKIMQLEIKNSAYENTFKDMEHKITELLQSNYDLGKKNEKDKIELKNLSTKLDNKKKEITSLESLIKGLEKRVETINSVRIVACCHCHGDSENHEESNTNTNCKIFHSPSHNIKPNTTETNINEHLLSRDLDDLSYITNSKFLREKSPEDDSDTLIFQDRKINIKNYNKNNTNSIPLNTLNSLKTHLNEEEQRCDDLFSNTKYSKYSIKKNNNSISNSNRNSNNNSKEKRKDQYKDPYTKEKELKELKSSSDNFSYKKGIKDYKNYKDNKDNKDYRGYKDNNKGSISEPLETIQSVKEKENDNFMVRYNKIAKVVLKILSKPEYLEYLHKIFGKDFMERLLKVNINENDKDKDNSFVDILETEITRLETLESAMFENFKTISTSADNDNGKKTVIGAIPIEKLKTKSNRIIKRKENNDSRDIRETKEFTKESEQTKEIKKNKESSPINIKNIVKTHLVGKIHKYDKHVKNDRSPSKLNKSTTSTDDNKNKFNHYLKPYGSYFDTKSSLLSNDNSNFWYDINREEVALSKAIIKKIVKNVEDNSPKHNKYYVNGKTLIQSAVEDLNERNKNNFKIIYTKENRSRSELKRDKKN